MFFIIHFSDSKPPTLSINQPWVDSETNIVSIWSQHICGKQECVNSHPIWSHLIAFRTFIQKKSSQKSTSLVAGCLLSPKRSAALSPLRIILGIPKKESESSQGSIWTSPGVFFLGKEKTCLFQGLWVSHLLEKFQMEPTGLMIALAPRSTFRCGRDTLVYRGYLWAIGVLLVWREICMPEYVIIGCISKETILKSINFMFKWSISLLDFLLIPDLPLPRLKIVALHVQICWCWS